MTTPSIPKGKHMGAARDCQWGYTKNGDPQIAVTFELVDGPAETQEITWFGYFTEKTKERTLESLRHCGWQGDDLAVVTAHALTETVELVVDHETYEGETRAKVRWVNKPGAGRFKMERPMGSDELRRFAQEMRGAARQVPAGSPSKSSSHAKSNGMRGAPPPRDTPPPVDEDLPF